MSAQSLQVYSELVSQRPEKGGRRWIYGKLGCASALTRWLPRWAPSMWCQLFCPGGVVGRPTKKRGLSIRCPSVALVRRVWRESCRRGTPRLREKAHVTSRTRSRRRCQLGLTGPLLFHERQPTLPSTRSHGGSIGRASQLEESAWPNCDQAAGREWRTSRK